MREGLETSPPPRDGKLPGRGSTTVEDMGPEAVPGPGPAQAEALHVGLSIRWSTVIGWLLLAAAALWLKLRYTSGAGAAPSGGAESGLGGTGGAFGFALGVLGCAMIVIGAVVHSFAKAPDSGARKPFVLNLFLCSLGGVCVLLASTSLPLGLAVAAWPLVLVACSMAAGLYLIGWIPESQAGGRLSESELVHRRQVLLQRLWTLTDVAPERLQRLLENEVPSGAGVTGALGRSIRYRFRPVLRRRRTRAAVDILEVPKPAIPEALGVVSEHARVYALQVLAGPMTRVLTRWRRAHVVLCLLAGLIVAVRLAALGSGVRP